MQGLLQLSATPPLPNSFPPNLPKQQNEANAHLSLKRRQDRFNKGTHLRLSAFFSSLFALLLAFFSSTKTRSSSGIVPPSTLDAPPPRLLPAVSPKILLGRVLRFAICVLGFTRFRFEELRVQGLGIDGFRVKDIVFYEGLHVLPRKLSLLIKHQESGLVQI